MVKRYVGGYMFSSKNGEWARSSDFDRMRRRYLVALCEERVKRRDQDFCYYETCGPEWQKQRLRALRHERWFQRMALAIERGEPLEYFSRLGQDK